MHLPKKLIYNIQNMEEWLFQNKENGGLDQFYRKTRTPSNLPLVCDAHCKRKCKIKEHTAKAGQRGTLCYMKMEF